MVKQLTILCVLCAVAWSTLAADRLIGRGRTGLDLAVEPQGILLTEWQTACSNWFPFVRAESASNYYDYSVATHDGTSAVANERPQWTTNGGGSYQFDGIDDLIDLGADHAVTSLTVMAWIKQTAAVSNIQGIVSTFDNGNNDGWSLRLSFTNRVQWILYDSSATAYIAARHSAASATTGQWIHVSAVWSGAFATTGITILTNGVVVADDDASSGTVNSFDTTDDYYIGTQEGATAGQWFPFSGHIDDVRFYSRALTTGEVRQVYLDGAGVHP